MRSCIIRLGAVTLTLVLIPIYSALATSGIPDNAMWEYEAKEHVIIPNGYTAATMWFQAVTLSENFSAANDGEAMVIIDYEKIIQKHANGTESVIFDRTFDGDSGQLSEDEGALYTRDPWYGNDDYHIAMSNSDLDGTYLNIDVGQIPTMVAHWWTTPRIIVEEGSTYFTEIRFKIIGKAAIQFGSDWWRDQNATWNGYDATCQNSNNCEAWVSDWYGDTGGEFVTVRAPLKLIDTAGLWQDVTDVGDGWRYFDWFGYFNADSAPWIYHQTLGWLYPYGTSTDSIWFYDPQWDGTGGWWWTSSPLFPWIYSVTEQTWLYFDTGDSKPGARWFFTAGGQASVH